MDDVDKAKHWYAEAFGIDPYFDEPYYVGFNIGGLALGLIPTAEKQKGSIVIAYWGVNNVEATYQKLLDLVAKQLNPITDVGGGVKLGVVQDPFGTPWELFIILCFNCNDNIADKYYLALSI
ncbi:VOC family protein [Thalassotalea euphylliae]|uniref:VOC family protein n=1 Tax=Thalassotalea euphylliae TaxID=1655234 RepID=UPI001C6F48A1|nr:VOC family protein [Thalassotalea euphylliae]